MNNEDEIDDSVDADLIAFNERQNAEEDAQAEKVESKASKDLYLRYFVPVALSLFLLILLLKSFGNAPEILLNFAGSLNSKPEFYVKAPEFADRNADILNNLPAEIPKLKEIPQIPGYNLLGSLTQRVSIEDRVKDIVYTLIYVSVEDREKRIVLHYLTNSGKVVCEFTLYSANRSSKHLRIYRIDERLITLIQINGKALVLVQEGTDIDNAEELCIKIFPGLKPS